MRPLEGAALGPVVHNGGDASVLLKGHPCTHGRAGHFFKGSQHVADLHVQARQVQRHAATKGFTAWNAGHKIETTPEREWFFVVGAHGLDRSTWTFDVAGAGVPVAKHGNRNLSSKSGAADALGELGINVMVAPAIVERAIAEAGIGFMMAPMHHPAMKHVMPVRQELGSKTIFNILGPLTNPARVKRQLTGAFAIDLIFPMAETLQALGSEAAWLVHGSDGTDEISISGTTSVAELKDGKIKPREVHPEEAGLPTHPFRDILGGTPAENAAALRALLDGAPGAYRDAVLLNAAAALVVAERADELRAGVGFAGGSLGRGGGQCGGETLARITQGA